MLRYFLLSILHCYGDIAADMHANLTKLRSCSSLKLLSYLSVVCQRLRQLLGDKDGSSVAGIDKQRMGISAEPGIASGLR